jgi:hypothetical protein
MKLPHKIFWKYRNKNFPGHKKIQMSFYKGFKTFVTHLGSVVYRIAEDENISDIKKYWIVLECR